MRNIYPCADKSLDVIEENEMSWCSLYLISKIVGLILVVTGLVCVVLFAAGSKGNETIAALVESEVITTTSSIFQRRENQTSAPYVSKNKYRGVVSFLKPGWLRGENVVQVKHFDACTLYFLKNRGGQNHPNHPGNYTSGQILMKSEKNDLN